MLPQSGGRLCHPLLWRVSLQGRLNPDSPVHSTLHNHFSRRSNAITELVCKFTCKAKQFNGRGAVDIDGSLNSTNFKRSYARPYMHTCAHCASRKCACARAIKRALAADCPPPADRAAQRASLCLCILSN